MVLVLVDELVIVGKFHMKLILIALHEKMIYSIIINEFYYVRWNKKNLLF